MKKKRCTPATGRRCIFREEGRGASRKNIFENIAAPETGATIHETIKTEEKSELHPGVQARRDRRNFPAGKSSVFVGRG